ncbi:hypothetical protein BO79DRAFT_212364 [Aspergillus costaricaensis CBS 115574]|uniref:Uncharacterized protein n=1 Tax=Aspergillus costaricaensis CBS 115574 TaxID=1448317 RepID=A0ACD1ITS6_9EURO|nr:hypothetical protein BO79DRAFT_212364 [Aspergillus costaricaensis CBS 115574]RAK94103.1 hypothetical protein BO79DRAFT_212364 [Aspergillus costaricaensis CBS 115574]
MERSSVLTSTKSICNQILLLGDTHDQPSHRPCRLPIDHALRPECNEIDGEDDDPDYTPLADVAEMHESPVRERPSDTLDLTINSFFFPVLVVVANHLCHLQQDKLNYVTIFIKRLQRSFHRG